MYIYICCALYIEGHIYMLICSYEFLIGLLKDHLSSCVSLFRYALEDLDGQNAFVLSLTIKVCLESTGTCYFEENVFNKVKVFRRLCQYSTSSSFPITGTKLN